MAEVNLFGLLVVEGVANDFPTLFEQNCHVLPGEPVTHPLLQLRDGHPIAVSLVADQLVIQFTQKRTVVGCGAAMGHDVTNSSEGSAFSFG